MQWIEVSVPTRSDEIDDVCAQLAELGAGGMVVEDETDFQQFLEQNHQYWDYVDDALEAQFRGVSRIKFSLADDDDGHAQLAAIRAGIGRELTTTTVRDSDWENNWRQYYQPIETGERLVVVPEWLDAPADGRLPLRLDPGLIFGTGSHATTRMCLAALEHCAGADRTVLDLGCGYGWHCIYAMEQGAMSVTGVDLSEKMLEVAREKTHFPQARYLRMPIEEINFAENSFDIVLSSLALHYVASFDAVAKRVNRCLVAGGSFVFSAEHPIFTAYGTQDWYYDADGKILHFPVDNYFYEGKRTAHFLGEEVVKYHKTLTTYLDSLLTNGFEIQRVVEPQPPAHMMELEGMRDEMRRPMMLIVAARKQ